MTETTPTNEATDQALVQMLTGAWTTQLIAAVARLGIPDQLAIAQPQSSEQLARTVDADAGALHRVMRALTSLGVFADDGSGHTHSLASASGSARASRLNARLLPR